MTKIPAVLFGLVILFSTTFFAQPNRNKLSSETLSQSVGQKKRVALVMGNNAYKQIPRLKNAVNDAIDVAKVLKELGFDVTLKTDVETREEMHKFITDWSVKIPSGGVALFYYAGHGAQIDGTNYLFPISAKDPFKADVKQNAVDLDIVLHTMSNPDSGHSNIIIIDACRNRLRGFPGLAGVIGPIGTFIAYATAPGSYASDGARQNGLFTEHLLKNIKTPDLKIEDMFKLIRRQVTSDETNEIGQLPWDASSLLEDFYFNPQKKKPKTEDNGNNPSTGVTKSTILRPTIRITKIPVYDPEGGPASLAKIEGDISGVIPEDFRVVLYSLTDKWYIQPNQDNPFIEIRQDGKWNAEIHTGTRYAALLVKADFKPRNTIFKLPDIDKNAVAVTTEIGRKQ